MGLGRELVGRGLAGLIEAATAEECGENRGLGVVGETGRNLAEGRCPGGRAIGDEFEQRVGVAAFEFGSDTAFDEV